MQPVSRVILRQMVLSFAVVVLSLLLLSVVQRALGLGAPPRIGVILVSASVVFAWVSGGVLGMLIGAAARARRLNGSPLIALLAGLVWGGILCGAVIPLYLEIALEAMMREGVGQVWQQRAALLNRTTGLTYALEAAKTLAWSGAGRLPVLSLLVWTLIGPAIAGGFEAWRAVRRGGARPGA